MDKFELKIDVNTPYIRTIRFIGALMVGIVIGGNLITYKSGMAIDWLNSFSGVMLGLFFAFFPSTSKKQSLSIDENGIHTHHYKFHWGERNEIKWENISAIGVEKNKIHIKNTVGSSEKISLPIPTEEQISNLQTYLREVTKIKQIDYLA